MYITEYISGASKNTIFKAVKGKQYGLTDIHISIVGSGTLEICVLDSGLHEIESFAFSNLLVSRPIAALKSDSSLVIKYDFHYSIPIETRFFQIMTGSSNSNSFLVVVNYELLNISKSDAICEFVKKSR